MPTLPTQLLIASLALLFGLCVGSFAATAIDRAFRDGAPASLFSRCDSCGHRLTVVDLLPVLSFVLQRGRCRYCKGTISPWYPGTEAAFGIVSVWGALVVPTNVLPSTLILGWLLVALALSDLRALILPNVLTAGLAISGILTALALAPDAILDHLVGAAAGFATFFAIRLVYARIRGRDGLGPGDEKLVGGAGTWVAWQGLASVILIGALSGITYALVRAAFGRAPGRLEPLPFGTFLCFSTWLVWLYGPILWI
ncbi:MAG: prepilin peptidase [bacterium]|nr:prepilin peptidase [bacterium]